MNPNDQPREFGQPSEPNPSEFGAPVQPEASNSSQESGFSTNSEPITPVVEPTPVVPPVEAQPFGQPLAPQPAFSSPQFAPVGQPPVMSGENPGQVFGIISIVLSFVGLSIVGIILGVVSRNKSKAAGASTTLGTVGMVLGIVSTVLAVLAFLLILVPAILLAAVGAQEGYKDAAPSDSSNYSSGSSESSSSDSPASNLASQASRVAKKAEAYKAIAGDYPKYSSDFKKYSESTIDSDIYVYTMFVSNKNVSYFYCGAGAAQVVYYGNASGTTLNITPLGTASGTESCVEIKQ